MSDVLSLLQKVCMNPKPQTAFHTLQNTLNFPIHDKCGPIQWTTQMMNVYFSVWQCATPENFIQAIPMA